MNHALFLYLDRIGFGAILEQMLHVLVNEDAKFILAVRIQFFHRASAPWRQEFHSCWVRGEGAVGQVGNLSYSPSTFLLALFQAARASSYPIWYSFS